MSNGKYYQDDITVNVKDENLEKITAKVYANNYEIVEIQNGDVLSQESIYYLTATDKAGNSTSIYVAVDKTNPVFTTLQNGHQYDKEVTIEVEDLKLKTIEVFSYEDGTTKVVENGTKLSEDGTYKIIATDYSGRSTQIYIEIDTIAPEIKGLDNGEYVNKNEIVTVTDKNLASVTINGVEQEHDGKKFQDKLTHEGTFVIVATDRVGHKTEKKVTIDKTAPTADVTFSNNNGNAMTNKDVTVTLKASEAIKNIEGWTKVDDKTFTKVYSKNGKYSVEIEDLAGNVSLVRFEVKRIDKEAPVLTLNGDREIVIELGKGQYEELGAVANDNMDKVVQVPEPSKIDWYGQNGAEEFNVDKVDVNREGKYNVFYTYTDKAGNKGEIIRKVYVKDYSRVELSEPTYKKLDNGNVLVTIEANKLIEVPEGWDLSADGKSISREYSSNTDYYGEKIVVKGVNGGKDDVIVKISDFEDKDVICIDSSESLRKLASDINNGTSFAGKTIKLTSDINLSGEKWTPIYAGKGVLNNATIDGDGYTINGMNTYRDPGETNGTVETPYGNGFISDNTGTLTIKNIVFTNVSITDPTGGTDTNYTQHYVGTVVGHNQGNLNIENVTVKNANIKTSWQGGGLVGYSSKNLTFDNCKIYNSYVGGFNATTGSIFGLGIIDVNINNCIASNVKLYTDSLTFDSTAKREGNFWVGSLYPQKGTVLTVTNSTEKDVVVVDSEM